MAEADGTPAHATSPTPGEPGAVGPPPVPPPGGRTGRPYKRTPEAADRIEQALVAGATYALAAQYGGISPDTLTRWRQDDAAFAERLARAEATTAIRLLAQIERLGQQTEDWRALAWKLERRHPEQFGKVLQAQVSGPGGGPIQEQRITRIIVQPPPPPRLRDGAAQGYRDRLPQAEPSTEAVPTQAEPTEAVPTQAGGTEAQGGPAGGTQAVPLHPTPPPAGQGKALDLSPNARVTAVSSPTYPTQGPAGQGTAGQGTAQGGTSVPPSPPQGPAQGRRTGQGRTGQGRGAGQGSRGTPPEAMVSVDGVDTPSELSLLIPYADEGSDDDE